MDRWRSSVLVCLLATLACSEPPVGTGGATGGTAGSGESGAGDDDATGGSDGADAGTATEGADETSGGAMVCDDPGPADRDLDGQPDRDDAHPSHPFHDVWTEARAQRHRETPIVGTLTATWDGRLAFGATFDGAQFEYDVRAFRPDSVDTSASPILAEGENFSAPLAFDPFDTSDGNLHIGVFPDPVHLPAAALGHNPYRSDAAGAPTAQGSHRTYKLGIIGVDASPAGSPHNRRLTLNRGTVVVAAPDTNDAQVVVATIDATAQPLVATNGAQMWRYEPTVSLDGRLVIWHGLPRNQHGGTAALYTYNPTPMQATGWSPPANLAAMHYVHGPGAAAETMVDGVPFSERYPIARHPLRDPDGTVLGPDDLIPAPYPWLSPDASEVFFSTIATFTGATQTAVAAVGQRTGWTLRHLDGAINPCRSTLSSDGEVHFTTTPEGAALAASYALHTLPDGSPLGNVGYARVLLGGMYLTGSMWDPYLGAAEAKLPVRGGDDVFGFLFSTRRYVEQPLGEVVDGHYLLALPLGEEIAFDRPLLTQFNDGLIAQQDFWYQLRRGVTYLPTQTPDVSGHRQTGTLRDGAAFPFEYHDAPAQWQAYYAQVQGGAAASGAGVAGDTIDGIVGNAVYFPPGSSVTSALSESTRGRLDGAPRFTTSLWVKPLDDGTHRLVDVAGRLVIHRDGNDVVVAIGGAEATTRAFDPDVWTHVAVVVAEGTATLYLDGEIALQFDGTAPTSTTNTIVLGPADMAAGSTAIVLLDEFKLSDVARTMDEIRVEALRRRGSAPLRGADLDAPSPLADTPVHIPNGAPPPDALATLGQDLFEDPGLSRDGTISCASCHDARLAFTDGEATATGIDGLSVGRNTPSVLGRAFARRQFWDGRAASLESQALAPIEAPNEMGSSIDAALAFVNGDADYAARFEAIFGPQCVGPRQLADALAAYQRTLMWPLSPFDTETMSESARRGEALFFGEARCVTCHRGPTFTDERFHNVGLLVRNGDTGRAQVTGREADHGRFKTPSLRELTRTAPYFHDGRAATLADVVAHYNAGGETSDNLDVAIRPLGLDDAQQSDLVAFLEALSSP